jgi:galactosylceramidase
MKSHLFIFIFLYVNAVLLSLALPDANYFVNDLDGIWTTFDGIGAISGGGATSKLLVNYPEPHRSNILDYLFKPKFGASLHILKVEIGGDSQSSDGSESSHMHTPFDENYNRGYEWWLMKEAKKRNPDIKFYGLPWTFPGWVGAGKFDPFANRTATVRYIMNWIDGAWRQHGLKINYIGVWNERNCDKEYVKVLRATLDAEGHGDIKIIVPDAQSWAFLKEASSDLDYRNAFNIIGQHYPGATTPDEALRLDKTLWASEEFSAFNDLHGAACWARVLAESPVTGFYSGFIAWNLITSYYDYLPYTRSSLMTANEPWSGNYEVSSPIWISAHHTQFYEPGWTYLRHGRGVEQLRGNGTFITVTCPERQQLTIVIETLDPRDAPCFYYMPVYTVAEQQVAHFKLAGSFSAIEQLFVWYSYLDFSSNKTVLFEELAPVQIVNGSFSMTLNKNEVYTLTTVSNGVKGDHGIPPPPKFFPLPYLDTFEDYQVDEEPFNLAQQSGSFAVTDLGDLVHGKVMTQVVTEPPVDTCLPDRMPRPVNLIGNFSWTNVSVEVDVLLGKLPNDNQARGVFLGSNVDTGGCWTMYANGIYLWMSVETGIAKLTGNHSGSIVYDAVVVQKLQYDKWFTMGLHVDGTNVTATFNGKTIMSCSIPRLPSPNGFVALGPDRFGIAHFDNLRIMKADRTSMIATQKLNSMMNVAHMKPSVVANSSSPHRSLKKLLQILQTHLDESGFSVW